MSQTTGTNPTDTEDIDDSASIEEQVLHLENELGGSSEQTLHLIMAHYIRRESVHTVLRQLLPDKFFLASEPEYIAVMRCVDEFFDENNYLPTYPVLSSLVERECSKKFYPTGTERYATGLIEYAFDDNWASATSDDEPDETKEQWQDDVVIALAVKVSHSRTTPLLEQQMRTAADSGGDVREILRLGLDTMDARQTIAERTNLSLFSLDPHTWPETDVDIIPTDVPFLDYYLDGGCHPAEVQALLGPIGGGKTLTGIQIAVQSALAYPQLKLETGEHGMNFYFAYECGFDEIWGRVFGCAGQINALRARAFFKARKDPALLSRAGQLEPYEQNRSRFPVPTDGTPQPGEYERYCAVEPVLSQHLSLIDCSANHRYGFKKRGSGGVDEIAAYIDAYVSAGGVRPRHVVVDHAGPCVDNYINSGTRSFRGDSDKVKYGLLKSFILECSRKIASRFDCCVWVLHQLNSEARRKRPTAEFTDAMAADCNNFTENAWNAFVLGTKDDDSNCVTLRHTKTRNSEPRPPRILKVEGDIARMVDVTDSHQIAASEGRLLPNSESRDAIISTGDPYFADLGSRTS